MNAVPPSKNSSAKPARRTSCARLVFQLLRMFWLTELALLLVVLYGLRAGWSAPQQWSDGFFIAAALQVVIAGITMVGSSRETEDASWVRYVVNSNITETRQQLVLSMMRKETFGLRAFLGGLLTVLIAVLVSRV